MTPTMQRRVKEFHPELAWQRLAGRLLASKHTAQGSVARLRVLVQQGAPPPWDWQLSADGLGSVALDDALDALVGLSTANLIARGPEYCRRLPEGEPPTEERGLKMEIWF